MAYGSIICDLCTEILIYDSCWEITSKDFFKSCLSYRGFFSNDHKTVRCPSCGGVCFIESFIIVKSYTKTIGACEKCPFYGGVRLTEVSVSRELTVFSIKRSSSPSRSLSGVHSDGIWIKFGSLGSGCLSRKYSLSLRRRVKPPISKIVFWISGCCTGVKLKPLLRSEITFPENSNGVINNTSMKSIILG